MLCAVNSLGHTIVGSLTDGVLYAALNLFGISAVVGFAIVVLERISAAGGATETMRPFDLPILIAAGTAAFVPVDQLSGFVVLGLGLWFLLASNPVSRCRRIGVVLLALSGPLVWSHIAMSLFSQSILSWDAQVVGALANSPVDGNIVRFVGRKTAFYVGGPCSSLQHLTLATLLWACVTQLLGHAVNRRSLLICAAAMVAVILVNLVRLTAIATFPDQFTLIHDGWIAPVFGWAALLIAGAIVAFGSTRAVRA